MAATLVEKKIADMGGKIYEPSNYFLYYKDSNANSYHPEPLTFTIDKLAECEPFDPKAKRERWAQHHKLRTQGLKTAHNVLSSQQIGRHQIIPGKVLVDDPRSDGHGRSAALRSTLFYPNHLHV